MSQLWLFWAAPVAGAIVGALIYRMLLDTNQDIEADVQVVNDGAVNNAGTVADIERARRAQLGSETLSRTPAE